MVNTKFCASCGFILAFRSSSCQRFCNTQKFAKHPTPQKDFNLNLNKAGEISGAEAPCWARPAGMVSFVFVKVIEGKFSAGRTTTDVVVPPTDIEVTSELTFYGLLGHALADRSQKYLGWVALRRASRRRR